MLFLYIFSTSFKYYQLVSTSQQVLRLSIELLCLRVPTFNAFQSRKSPCQRIPGLTFSVRDGTGIHVFRYTSVIERSRRVSPVSQNEIQKDSNRQQEQSLIELDSQISEYEKKKFRENFLQFIQLYDQRDIFQPSFPLAPEKVKDMFCFCVSHITFYFLYTTFYETVNTIK